MITSINTQTAFLCFSLIGGMIIGLFFDFYRLFRGFGNPNKIVTLFEDLLFWIFISIVTFIFLLYTIQGYIGFYIYLYIGLGIYIYLKFISKRFIKIGNYSIRLLCKIVRIGINYIIYPLEKLIYSKRKE